MTKKGILYVESGPATPEQLEAFNDWYDNTHLDQMLAIEGVVAARRFAPVLDDGPFAAVYELEADDLTSVMGAIREAITQGAFAGSEISAKDPSFQVRLLEQITSTS